MSDSPALESPPTTLLGIIYNIKEIIIKYFIIFSSSSSSYTETQWAALECLFNPRNTGFTNYLLEHKAFTLKQITCGSGSPSHRCRYIIDKLIEGKLLVPSYHARGFTKPFIIYLLRGEDSSYVDQALKLHLDSLGLMGQSLLNEVDDWENLFVNDLLNPTTVTKRIRNNLKTINRVDIVQDNMKAHPTHEGYDKKAVKNVESKLVKNGWRIVY